MIREGLLGRFGRIVPAVGGWSLVALGIVVLVGWSIESVVLIQGRPSLTPMQGNTAVAFVACGLALLALHAGRRAICSILGAAVGLLAAVVFSQYALGWDLGIDELLFDHTLAEFSMASPGRMAPNTAVAFVLAGLALLLVARRRAITVVAPLGSVILTLGVAVLLGIVFGFGSGLAWGDLNRMALSTSVGFIVLGAALIGSAVSQQSDEELTSASARRAALLVGAMAALMSVLLWNALRVQQESRLERALERTAAGLSEELAQRFDDRVDVVVLLAGSGWNTGRPRTTPWSDAARLGLSAVEGLIEARWIRPGEPDELLAGPADPHPPSVGAMRRRALDRVGPGGSPSVVGPVELPGDGVGAWIVVPIGDGRPGHLAVLAEIDAVIGRLIGHLAPDFAVTLRCEGRPVLTRGVAATASDSLVGLELDVPGEVSWSVELRPQDSYLAFERSALPDLALFGGLVIAVLLASTVWFGAMASRRARRFQDAVRTRTVELERAMASLSSENAERRRTESLLARTQDVSRTVSAELDLDKVVQTVTDAARELSGAAYTAFFYNRTDDSGESYMLYALSGIDPAKFDGYPMPRATKLFEPTFHGERVVRCDDVRDHEDYGANVPHRGLPTDHPMEIVSYMAVPVISRSGAVWGGLLFGHDERARFGEREESIATALAAQTAIALDNASLLERERRARDEAQAASAAKDRFLSIASHELRNPLGSIRSALEVLDREVEDLESERRMRSVLKRQVVQLARLVDDLLDVSRIINGKVAFQLERIDLTRLVRDAVEGARARVEAADRTLHAPSTEEPIWVDADPSRMLQALDNLLVNAEKFTDAGGAIRVGLVRDAASASARLTVADDGRGIEPAERAELFEPFYQSRRRVGHDEVRGGMGLGLAIVKGIVASHDGRVEVHSDGVGTGASFTITLPTTDPPAAHAPGTDGERPPTQRILLIDDHADSLEALAELLQVDGHRVTTAGDGDAGLAAASELAPDVVICDLGMPGTDGYAVARALRATDPDLYLIALSGFGDEAAVARALASGFDVHTTKPIEPERIRSLLTRGRPVGEGRSDDV